jgi:hypothetical protein
LFHFFGRLPCTAWEGGFVALKINFLGQLAFTFRKCSEGILLHSSNQKTIENRIMFTGMKGWSPQNSTPNSTVGTPANNPDSKKSAPPISDEEMLKKVQYMISLQMAAAQDQPPLPDSASSSGSSPTHHRNTPSLIPDFSGVEGASITPAAAAELRAAAAATGRRFASSNEKPPPAPRPPPPPPTIQSAPPQIQQQPRGRSIMGSIPYQDYAATSASSGTNANTQQQIADVGVGQGHLYFPGGYQQPEYSREEQHPMLGDGTNIPHYGLEYHDGMNHGYNTDDPDHLQREEPQEHDWGCLQTCFDSLRNTANDSLHQSFCFASIDGMLTGAGLVAAFLGMGVLNPRRELHFFVVAFSLAACFSDALCMAVGHVWSTFVLTNASAKERRMERLSFETSRADCKAKLVDLLLSRGMLKIDAMSIADTLEGYPDIFISTLVGDAGLLGEDALLPSSSNLFEQEQTTFSPLLRMRQSLGRFNIDQELDAEASGVRLALAESRKEAIIMMMSFTMFSVMPSLIFTWLSHVMNVSVKHRASGGTSVTSIAVSLLSLIMLLLGFWKSRFFTDCHWILFGIETVVVLWMCTLSAYFIGYGLSLAIPGLRGVLANQGD